MAMETTYIYTGTHLLIDDFFLVDNIIMLTYSGLTQKDLLQAEHYIEQN